jgi:hypothetical protein
VECTIGQFERKTRDGKLRIRLINRIRNSAILMAIGIKFGRLGKYYRKNQSVTAILLAKSIMLLKCCLQEQLTRLQKKRRQYSWQQAEGIITVEELRIAHKQIRSEENITNEQLGGMEAFRSESAPPDMATFKKLSEYWAGVIAGELYDAPDDVRA